MKKVGSYLFLGLFLLLPITAAAVYWGKIATERYVSTSKLVVQKNGSSGHQGNELSALIGIGSGSANDALMVKEYMISRAMLHKLNEFLQLRDHYSDENLDLLSRFSASASEEDLYDYYRQHIRVDYDEASSIIDLQFEAFNAETAQKASQLLIMESELFLNDIGHNLAESQVDFAQNHLSQSRNRLKNAKRELLSFQNENGVVSPEDQSKLIGSIIGSLEGELADKQARLSTISTYLNPNSSEVRILKSQISALRAQVNKQQSKLVGKANGPLNKLSAEYQDLLLEIGFSQDVYSTTLAAVETARIDASQKIKHLVVIEPPSLPDSAQHPKRLYNFVTTTVLIFLAYWIAKLSIATIKDHKD